MSKEARPNGISEIKRDTGTDKKAFMALNTQYMDAVFQMKNTKKDVQKICLPFPLVSDCRMFSVANNTGRSAISNKGAEYGIGGHAKMSKRDVINPKYLFLELRISHDFGLFAFIF